MGPKANNNQTERAYNAVYHHCILRLSQVLDDLKLGMRDRGESGSEVSCHKCRERHYIGVDDLHLAAPDLQAHQSGKGASCNLPEIPPNAGPNWCRWHRTSSPMLTAPCAHVGCAYSVHVHQDMLGALRPGRGSQGWLVEKCPHGHHDNAVMLEPGFDLERAVYLMDRDGKNEIAGAVRTARLVEGRPVLQLRLKV